MNRQQKDQRRKDKRAAKSRPGKRSFLVRALPRCPACGGARTGVPCDTVRQSASLLHERWDRSEFGGSAHHHVYCPRCETMGWVAERKDVPDDFFAAAEG